MRLSDFIVANREAILAEWEAFARTCAPASTAMDIVGLRDHASEMLTVFAADLKTPQTAREEAEKSKGNAADDVTDAVTAAEAHGADRAESGFTVEQMVSEYRALRASVIRLWRKVPTEACQADLDDLTRFHEAIDQALAESIVRYTADLDRSKDMFLAILGHDLRTPLSAVVTAASFMLETQGLKEPSLTLTSRIASSSARMVRLVGDLLDFTRTRLGGGIPIVRADADMEHLVHDVVDEVTAAHPLRTFRVEASGDQRGAWDPARISQVLTNVIVNALDHGSERSVVAIDVRGMGEAMEIAIHNHGPAIPADELNGLFNPMKGSEGIVGPSGNLGLGLYIADRIVSAHGGTIEVASSEATGTTFTVHLPRSERRSLPRQPA